ncbi:zinc-ribbon domain-containing protein [Methanobacterium formicicum]
MMLYNSICSNCGSHIEAGANFCSECGYKLI